MNTQELNMSQAIERLAVKEARMLSNYQRERDVPPIVDATAGAMLAAVNVAASVQDHAALADAVDRLCAILRITASRILEQDQRLSTMQ